MPPTAAATRRAPVRVRPATDADLDLILEIGSAVFPDYPETLEEFRDVEERLRAGGYVSVHSVAEIPEGIVVG